MTSREPPPVARFRPADLARDWDALRRDDPVSRVAVGGDTAWLVTRYDDVRTVLADARFSVSPVASEPGEAAERNDSVFQDPPGHTRLRRLVSKPFSPARVQRLEASIQARAERLLARTAEAGGSFDLMESFAYPLTMNTIADVIGIPDPDRTEFRRCADDLLVPSEAATAETVGGGWRRLNEYVGALIRSRRADGGRGDDVVAVLLEARDERSLLNEDELVTMVLGLPIAGYVSTANAIAVAVGYVVGEGWLRRLRSSPELVEPFVEEVLRLQSGDNGESMPRFATVDVELGGTLIRRGEMVIAPLVAANRDASVFDRPLAFDPRREPNCHLAFGYGIHRCLGAVLAQVELQCALRAMVAAPGSLALQQDWGDVPWRSNMFGDRYPGALTVSWRP